MCDVVTALKIGTAIYSYQSQKAIAKSQQRANTQTQRSSDKHILMIYLKLIEKQF